MSERKILCSIDGAAVDAKAFQAACKTEEIRHAIIGDEKFGNHGFTSDQGQDKFLRNQRELSAIYKKNEGKPGSIRKTKKEVGKTRIRVGAQALERRGPLH